MRVTIHQPNFCPYMGVFEKVAAADLFVVLTHAQWEKGGYQNRFEADGKWYTMAVNRGLEPIAAKRYLRPREDWERIRKRYPKLSRFDNLIGPSLADTNVAIIRAAAAALGITTPIVLDEPTALTGTDRLIDLCRRHGATAYLSGPSGRHYMDLRMFETAGIRVEFHGPADKRPLAEALP